MHICFDEYKNKAKLLFLLAHGESWEVAASHAVSDLVKKILAEENNAQEHPQQNGTFQLHYIPANTQGKPISIPLSTPDTLNYSWSTPFLQNNIQQDTKPYTTIRF